jgi:hypothetical protein
MIDYFMRIRERWNGEEGWMGPTHILSGIAFLLAMSAWLPSVSHVVLATAGLASVFIAAINFAGASISPDIDNTTSTIKSTLGPFGNLLSTIARGISTLIQGTIKKKKDDFDDPHRGFWHTAIAGLLVGLTFYFLTALNIRHFSIPILHTVDVGKAIAIILTIIMGAVALRGFFGKIAGNFMRSIRGQLITWSASTVITIFLYSQSHPKNLAFIGIALGFGWIIHILGDNCTKSGAPLLWPIPIGGKLWWNIRFTTMAAGGKVENKILVPTFSLIILISLIKLCIGV